MAKCIDKEWIETEMSGRLGKGKAVEVVLENVLTNEIIKIQQSFLRFKIDKEYKLYLIDEKYIRKSDLVSNLVFLMFIFILELMLMFV